jgi:hypothetical protein
MRRLGPNLLLAIKTIGRSIARQAIFGAFSPCSPIDHMIGSCRMDGQRIFLSRPSRPLTDSPERVAQSYGWYTRPP